ncbi:hypothetical protein [Arenimonas sp. MALMAid1274]|uniref:COG4315 family predicted lipoprotein n=1 Tax=Arenimonas sp. MALMAid1274 TaxID=3411630 RepID=UPI003BA26101
MPLLLLLAAASPLALAATPVAPARAGTASTTAPAPAARRLSPSEIAAASPVPIWRRNGVLVEFGGRALYTFTDDKPGQSACDSRCEALWPPHYAEPDAKPVGPFTLARSSDGRPMWAWQGQPLYRWVSDRRRGSAGGDGVADKWFLVKVPATLESQVTAYYPMPMRRPAPRPTPSAAQPSGNRP